MSDSCPGCGKEFSPCGRGSIGDKARAISAMPSLSYSGKIHYLCMPCAQEACELARKIVSLHGGDDGVSLHILAVSDPTDVDPLGKVRDGQPSG